MGYNRGGVVQSSRVAKLRMAKRNSEWTLDELRREGFSDQVMSAIDALTRRDGEER